MSIVSVESSRALSLFCHRKYRWLVDRSTTMVQGLGGVHLCSRFHKLPASVFDSGVLRYKFSMFSLDKCSHQSDESEITNDSIQILAYELG